MDTHLPVTSARVLVTARTGLTILAEKTGTALGNLKTKRNPKCFIYIWVSSRAQFLVINVDDDEAK